VLTGLLLIFVIFDILSWYYLLYYWQCWYCDSIQFCVLMLLFYSIVSIVIQYSDYYLLSVIQMLFVLRWYVVFIDIDIDDDIVVGIYYWLLLMIIVLLLFIIVSVLLTTDILTFSNIVRNDIQYLIFVLIYYWYWWHCCCIVIDIILMIVISIVLLLCQWYYYCYCVSIIDIRIDIQLL